MKIKYKCVGGPKDGLECCLLKQPGPFLYLAFGENTKRLKRNTKMSHYKYKKVNTFTDGDTLFCIFEFVEKGVKV